MNLQGKSFLKLLDFTPAEIEGLLDLSARLKAEKKAGQPHPLCQGKNIALLFEKTSTRTRCAFEVAARDLGMGVTYLDPSGSQMGAKESVADTARVLGRMYDGIEYRGFAQSTVEQLAEDAPVRLVVQVLDVRSVEQFRHRGNLLPGIHLQLHRLRLGITGQADGPQSRRKRNPLECFHDPLNLELNALTRFQTDTKLLLFV